MANHPPLILADEPTGNLDSKSGREVMAMMSELALERNKAVIIVTHDNRIMKLTKFSCWKMAV